MSASSEDLSPDEAAGYMLARLRAADAGMNVMAELNVRLVEMGEPDVVAAAIRRLGGDEGDVEEFLGDYANITGRDLDLMMDVVYGGAT